MSKESNELVFNYSLWLFFALLACMIGIGFIGGMFVGMWVYGH